MKHLLFKLTLLASICFAIGAKAQEPESFKNPILSGFYPDPSICRVGNDYYLVHSSFEYFPGVPIFHSTDLVHWEQIGHVLDRPSQLNLPDGLEPSRGIFAPTLRHHNDTFYMVTTCVGCGGNFYVTASNPAGPWSDPIWVKDAPGIDPTLFWDDDGSAYYIGGHNLHGYRAWPGQNGAFIQKIDMATGKLLDQPVQMTFGHATNAVWGEAPHIYKINGRYMLMIAEGGTSIHHAITVFESDSLMGTYTPSLINPVLTHRHLGKDYPIAAVGHADLVQTQNKEWWAVLLATRPVNQQVLLGRETFLVPLVFEDGWPVFNPGKGIVESEMPAPKLPPMKLNAKSAVDGFEAKNMAYEWNMLRTPTEDWYKLEQGKLHLLTRPQKLSENNQPSFWGRRIQHFTFEAFTKVEFNSNKTNEEAGFVALLDSKNQYRLVKSAKTIKLFKVEKGTEVLLAENAYKGNSVVLGLKADVFDYQFYFGSDINTLEAIGEKQDARVCGPSSGVDFTGPYVGMYTSSNGIKSKSKAMFDWFKYAYE
ncbi:MAG: glycoside hydrolase family 43 protein [Salinivirgaceae bacterium]